MSPTSRVRFGIMTAPQQVTYDGILRVWHEADAIPQIEHAWLFDHLFPIAGDRTDIRRMDAAVRAGRADPPTQNRPAGHQQPLPATGDAGQDRYDRGHRLGRATRLRHRRRLPPEPADSSARIRGTRPAVPRP